jgi:hypothetical protein
MTGVGTTLISAFKARGGPKLSSSYNLLFDNGLELRSGLAAARFKAGFCEAFGRTPCWNANRAARTNLSGPPDIGVRDPRRGDAYREPGLVAGPPGVEAGALTGGASLPFSRTSDFSRVLSGCCSIPLPDTSCAASTV